MAVSTFTYDLYLQMRSERHMDLVSSLALLDTNRGDCWKECWPCGLAFEAVPWSRHLSSLPCVDVTALSGLEVFHFEPSWSPAPVLWQFLGHSATMTSRVCFQQKGDIVTVFITTQFPMRINHLHIHWAFASDAQLIRPGNGVISGQLQGKSPACLSGMQMQKIVQIRNVG